MEESLFNVDYQNTHTASKIVAGLERISEAFRVLLWQHAKTIGLSPIQIQILLFIAFHAEKHCNVSALSKEFNLTKATISDAIKVLHKKSLILKHPSPTDKRAYSISLSEEGKKMVTTTQHFAHPLQVITEQLEGAEQVQFFQSLSKIIYGLHQTGILQTQRTCYACHFYEQREGGHFCRLLEVRLEEKKIRLDCPEFEQR